MSVRPVGSLDDPGMLAQYLPLGGDDDALWIDPQAQPRGILLETQYHATDDFAPPHLVEHFVDLF